MDRPVNIRNSMSASGLAFQRLGQGAPLLMLHGIPGSGASWLPAAYLLSTHFDIIIPDLLGFGGSARPLSLAELHAAGQAYAICTMLDELQLKKVIVVGHDFGGPVAIMLCARNPGLVSHLALFATNTFPDTPIPFPLSLITWPLIGQLVAPLLFSRASLAMMLRTGTGRPHVTLDERLYLGDASQVNSIRTLFQGSLANLATLYAPIEAQLAQIQIPTLVGWGSEDPFFALRQGERTARALRARLQIYDGAGHFIPEERPQRIADDIRSLSQN